MYKQASKLKLRVQTNKGLLSVEQLWDLLLSDLVISLKAVKKLLKVNEDDEELSFLGNETVIDIENQLRFDILKDVYLTRKKEAEESRNETSIRLNNDKINALIAAKNEGALQEMSVEELQKLLK